MEFNKATEAPQKVGVTKDYPKLGVKSSSTLDEIVQAITNKLFELEGKIDSNSLTDSSGSKRLISNQYEIKLTPKSNSVELTYNLKNVGSGEFIRSRFEVYSTNSYGTQYSIFDGTALSSSIQISPEVFPIDVYINYRELVDFEEVLYTEHKKVNNINEVIKDWMQSTKINTSAQISIKDKIKEIESEIVRLKTVTKNL